MNEMGETHGTYGTQDRCIQGFSSEILGKETSWKPRHKWEDNIKTYLQGVGRGNLE